MKAKELMVGDWVKYGKKKHQCYNVCGHTNHVMLDNGVFTNVMNIEPIALQRVHLVKNGFKAKDADDCIFVYNNGYEVKVMFDDGSPEEGLESYIFLKIDFADKDMTMEIRYVHELQHALRLFEVDKEIKL